MDFVEICNVCARKVIKAAKRMINSDKMCHSYSDLNYFGVTFLEHSVLSLAVSGYPAEVGALFTTVGLSSITDSRVSRVSVMVSVRDSVK